ncbi:FAD binding domain-containing protein [Salinigranum sp. GCM10025319]|uniref:FAD binding domain-containing protein n=1 Tax=Salinigranum sp. GCM10025319 TaxID=3252687 RepID=UPI00361A0AE1
MRVGETTYRRAESVDHALDLLDAHPDAEPLAAGHSLLSTETVGATPPSTVVDIGDLDALRGIAVESDVTRIGALTTYRAVERREDLPASTTVFSEAVGETADVQIRNRATIGGNLVTPYPVADLSAAVFVVDATLVAQDRGGERRLGSTEFLRPGGDGLDAGELLTAIEIPHPSESVGSAYLKGASPTSRYTLVGVAARLCVADGRVSDARVAANGVTPHAVRLAAVEDELAGERLDGSVVEAAAARAGETLDPAVVRDDTDASSRFRTHLLAVYAERALRSAAERAGVSIRG